MKILVIIFAVILCNCAIILIEPKTESSTWVLVSYIESDDSLNVIKVCYKEKCETEKIIYCKAIFENTITNEYKCVAPWLGCFLLQKCNLNSFQSKIVSKAEMK